MDIFVVFASLIPVDSGIRLLFCLSALFFFFVEIVELRFLSWKLFGRLFDDIV